MGNTIDFITMTFMLQTFYTLRPHPVIFHSNIITTVILIPFYSEIVSPLIKSIAKLMKMIIITKGAFDAKLLYIALVN